MLTAVDFETRPIAPRPDYPPEPVGVAIYRKHRRPRYYAWGHPTGNNCTYAEGRAALAAVFGGKDEIVFHNAKFDLAVATERMGLTLPDRARLHDTMLMAFLEDPYSPTLALKPLAERYLAMPPTERDAVKDWLLEHQPAPERVTARNFGAWIGLAPGDLVGRYAEADVRMTLALAEHLLPRVGGPAYDRERHLLPILLENERQGVRVDQDALAADLALYGEAMTKAEDWLRHRLGDPAMNLDSDAQLAEGLARQGIVTDFARTPKSGKPSVSKATLTKDKFSDQHVFLALGYRNRLQTCLSTFMEPWSRTGERIYTNWRQIGAATGRMSSSPNFQNMAKNWTDKPDGYAHPAFLGVPELPLLRKYILPDEGHVLLAADYSGQEVRMTAHFEDGDLLRAYRENPRLDPHTFVQETIAKLTGRHYERRICKVALFSTLYGAGSRKLAEQLGVTQGEAAQIRSALFDALPGVKDVDDELKYRASVNEAFRTAGGRSYRVEPPKVVDGVYRSFDYKCLNTLIQGSAADQTKAAMIKYQETRQHGRMLLFVHDELVLTVPEEHAHTEASLLVQAMETAMVLDVPSVAEVKMGRNFADMKAL